MFGEAILAPVCVLALWTTTVLFLTGYRRLGAIKKGQVPRNAFRLGESKDVPSDVSVVNRNLMNLLEMPVLFYVVCVSLFVTRQVQPVLVIMAWLFVGLRIVHSTIHLTSNRVVPRFFAFAISNLVLLTMWIWFAALIAFSRSRVT